MLEFGIQVIGDISGAVCPLSSSHGCRTSAHVTIVFCSGLLIAMTSYLIETWLGESIGYIVTVIFVDSVVPQALHSTKCWPGVSRHLSVYASLRCRYLRLLLTPPPIFSLVPAGY